MKWTVLLLLTFVAVLAGQQPPMQGYWSGTLNIGVMKLRLSLEIDAPGKASLVSIDQSPEPIPIDAFRVEGAHVVFTAKRIGASFSGELIDEGRSLQGIFRQNGLQTPLAFLRSATKLVLKRSQTPQPPFPYGSEDVEFSSVAAGVRLAGTLTIPQGKAPFPAVLLITGSGPQDRDESLMGHKPFWILADHLSRAGIAVLRVDDRGTAKSTGKFADATTLDFADDVEGGVRYLRSRKEIGKIGLLGHSEGGVIAPIVANRAPDVAFVVLMAGTGVPGDQVLIEQQALLLRAMNMPEEVVRQSRERQRKVLEIVKSEPENRLAGEKLEALFTAAELGAARPQLAAATGKWFRWFIAYDPAPALVKLRQPALVLAGSLDLQVSAAQNLPAIARALEEGGNPDYQIVKFPKLNHLFQTASTGAVSEYGGIEETLAPAVLETITNWIRRHPAFWN